MKSNKHIKSFNDHQESRLFESEDGLYRSIKKYYKTFLIKFLNDNDPDRFGFGETFGENINHEKFIEDCLYMFGGNGDDELVKRISRQVLEEEE